MESDMQGSVTHWLEGLKEGDSVAAQKLWNRYFARLATVAEARLGTLTRESSGEDIALSALNIVMMGVQENRFPDLTDRTGLWPLLVTIAARKSITHLRRQLAAKRNVAAEERIPDMLAIIDTEPSPEFAITVADELERLVRKFNDPMFRQIAQKKLAGFTNDEIAAELNCSLRTVTRKLSLIRQEWEEGEAANAEATDVE